MSETSTARAQAGDGDLTERVRRAVGGRVGDVSGLVTVQRGQHPVLQAAGPEGPRPEVTVVLPCYDEEAHVVDEVERITAALDAWGRPYEVLAVDDASTDATLARLTEALPRFPHLRVMPLPRNGGSGTARRLGTAAALGGVVVWTDADMTYPNELIPDLVDHLDASPWTDQVVGARTSEQGTVKVFRVPAKWAIRKLAERLTGTRIPDLNSGLRAFRREVALPYLRLLPPGFSCVTTITLAFLSNSHGVDYVPVRYDRRAGRSKFHVVRDAYRYLLQVVRMVMYFNPLAVLMPVALTLLGVGGAKVVYDVISDPVTIAINTVLLVVTGIVVLALALLADLVVRSRDDGG